MWANAQRDGRPAEYRWRPLFNAGSCISRSLVLLPHILLTTVIFYLMLVVAR